MFATSIRDAFEGGDPPVEHWAPRRRCCTMRIP